MHTYVILYNIFICVISSIVWYLDGFCFTYYLTNIAPNLYICFFIIWLVPQNKFQKCKYWVSEYILSKRIMTDCPPEKWLQTILLPSGMLEYIPVSLQTHDATWHLSQQDKLDKINRYCLYFFDNCWDSCAFVICVSSYVNCLSLSFAHFIHWIAIFLISFCFDFYLLIKRVIFI